MPDKRERKDYSMAELVTGAIAMFLFKEGSRNAFNLDRKEECFYKNYQRIFKMNPPHLDSTEDIFRVLQPLELEKLKAIFISQIIENKVFYRFKFLGKKYQIVVDGTGVISSDTKHCDQCIVKTSKNGVKTYFHSVLEAKLVTSNGFSISLASEWIANNEIKYDKQDSEHKAFKRMAVILKNYFPRMAIVILADGLYPNQHFFTICEDNNWNFIVTFKDGNLPSVWEEVNLLPVKAKGTMENILPPTKSTENKQSYTWCNNIDYQKHIIHWIECNEEIKYVNENKTEITRFVYVTDIEINKDNAVAIVFAGRLRWKIENEGFNTQKNGEYELEHKYSRVSFNALKNWYLTLQLAHLINQLTLLSQDIDDLKKTDSKLTYKHFWKLLKGLLVHTELTDIELFDPLHKKIQIRLRYHF